MRRVAAYSLCLLAVTFCRAAEPSQTQREFFEAKIRPLLAANCYECHSLEKGKAKGGLTLDTRSGWEKSGQSGPTVVPGKPEKSLLLKAVKHEDPDLKMPAKSAKLGDEQIAALAEWIAIGAPYPRDKATASKISGLNAEARAHWAYQPLRKPAGPAVKNQSWVQSPIDAFILEKLEAKSMTPNAPASRQALIRRAYFDMLGLPPSPQEVIAFVQDTASNAWEKVVGALLRSPHYGERWARHWLDTARYADTTGGDRKVREDYRYAHAWTYRDYVIRAFNDDKPYDQFVIEQLAADRLLLEQQGQNREALAALGFLTVGQRFQNPNDIINDRIDVLSKGLLGLTVTCARCHDHKFDPISQADYYALHGVFASSREPGEKPLLVIPDGDAYDDYLKKRAALEEQNRAAYFRVARQQLAQFCRQTEPLLLAMAEMNKRRGKGDPAQRLAVMKKHQLDPELVRRTFQGLQRAPFRSAEVFWPWRAFVNLPVRDFAAQAQALVADVTVPKPRYPVHPLVARAFTGTNPASLPEVAAIYGRLFSSLEPEVDSLINACSKSTDGTIKDIDADIAKALRTAVHVATANELNTEGLREAIARWQPREVYRAGFVFGQLNELDLTHPGAPPRAMAVTDAGAPADSRLFIRGQAELKGEVVPRRFLEVLGGTAQPAFREGSGRLELANAIVSPNNPLAPRVAVNRVWMHHFGEGLVPTPDDLGVQSEKPSHPELIEWLSVSFVENGWSLKQLHRLILLSNAYQQSSDTRPEYEKLDPQNRLLWRANIRRLDFEGVRDSLLVFSGRLDPTMFGQPVNITDEPYSYRRSVYGYVDRGNLPDLMQAFDFSDPDMPNSKRSTTVVPQQALFLMNSPLVVDVARKLVDRAEFQAARDDAGRVRALYEILFQRWPKPQEIALAQNFLRDGDQSKELPPMLASAEPINLKNLTREERRQLKKQGLLRGLKKNPGAPGMMGKRGDRRPIQNDGERVERAALEKWERYAQALLFANELAYVN
ncbi:MAG: DUF1553 domain-containing protein [Verrucomicrobiales bacterium]